MRNAETIQKEINELKNKLASVKGTETEVYTRIVGYYRSVRNWNKGKRDEYNHRVMFSQPDNPASKTVEAASCIDYPEVQDSAVSENEAVSYLYFYRTTCPNCPPVREWLDNFYMSGEAVNVDEKEGFIKAGQYRIYVSPTVVFIDSDGNEVGRATSTNALNALFAEVLV